MKRYGFVWRIRPEMKDQYKKDHDQVWPDMARAIRESGIRRYSIYFRKDGTLFSYYECDDARKAAEYMSKTEVNARWQKAMDKYFIKTDPSILGPEQEELEEVFHLD